MSDTADKTRKGDVNYDSEEDDGKLEGARVEDHVSGGGGGAAAGGGGGATTAPGGTDGQTSPRVCRNNDTFSYHPPILCSTPLCFPVFSVISVFRLYLMT